MNQDPVERLLGNLEATVHVYRQLLEIAEAKQRHIIANDIVQLQNDLRAEEKLVGWTHELNSRRPDLHRQAGAALRAPVAVKDLEGLCPLMAVGARERATAAHAALHEAVDRLRDVNRANIRLINNSIELVEGLIGALFDTQETAAYGPSGARARQAVPVCALDAQA